MGSLDQQQELEPLSRSVHRGVLVVLGRYLMEENRERLTWFILICLGYTFAVYMYTVLAVLTVGFAGDTPLQGEFAKFWINEVFSRVTMCGIIPLAGLICGIDAFIRGKELWQCALCIFGIGIGFHFLLVVVTLIVMMKDHNVSHEEITEEARERV